jgi:hypothetical protein
MKIVSIGLVERDHQVLVLFFKRFMPNWSYQSAPVALGQALPEAKIFLIDLAALGLLRHSPEAQVSLQQWLDQKMAVLLLPPRDTSWAEALQAQPQANCLPLAKPYNAESMRQVLTQAQELLAARPKPSPITASPLAAQPMASSKPTPASEPLGVDAQQLRSRLADLPVGKHVLLRKIDSALGIGTPFEIMFTVQHGLVIHPDDAWVASNTPMAVVLQVCRSDVMAASVTLRDIAPTLVEQRLHQLGMSLRDLDSFLMELLQASCPSSLTTTDPEHEQ